MQQIPRRQSRPSHPTRSTLIRAVAAVVLLTVAPGLTAADTCGEWTWANPVPSANQYTDVILAGDLIAAVGTSGLVAFGTSLESLSQTFIEPRTNLNGIAWNGSRFVVVGEHGTIQTSTDRVHWTAAGSPVTSDLQNVDWLGGRFVAVGFEEAVLTSPDGLLWTLRHHGEPDLVLTSVGYDGTTYVAVGGEWPAGTSHSSTSLIVTSGDGVSWARQELTTEWGVLFAVASNGATWVALGGNGNVHLSTDGLTWSPLDEADAQAVRNTYLTDLVWTGTSFVAGGDTSCVSSDGTSWVCTVPDQDFTPIALAASGPDLLGAGRFEETGISQDGLTWSLISSRSGLTATLNDICSGDHGLVAVGDDGTILTSTDGFSWTPMEAPTTRTLASVACHGDTILIARSLSSHIYQTLDGQQWNDAVAPSASSYPAHVEDVAWAGSRFVAVGDQGLWVSADGTDWSLVYSVLDHLDEPMVAVAWSGSRLVTVSQSSYAPIQTSEDGVSFELARDVISTTQSLKLYDTACGGGHCVVVGSDGAILVSDSSVRTWERCDSGVETTLRSVAWTGSRFVATGSDGVVLASPDGALWSRLETPTRQVLSGAAELDSAMAVVGYAGTLLVRGCASPAPVAAIEIEPDPPRAGEPIHLHDASTGEPDAWRWSFGDGSGATGPEVAHIYSEPGTYELQLEVSNMSGASTTGRQVVVEASEAPCRTGGRGFPLGGTAGLNDVARANGIMVAVGDGGAMLSSTDGIHWGMVPLGISTTLRGITRAGDQLVAVGDDGLVLRSTNGIDWSHQWLDGAPGLRAIAAHEPSSSERTLVAVGGHGEVAISADDGATWQTAAVFRGVELNDVVSSGHVLVAVGEGASSVPFVAHSTDPHQWQVETPDEPGALRTVVWAGDRFLATDILHLWSSADGSAWEQAGALPNDQVRRLAWTGTDLLALAGRTFLASPDGATWTEWQSGLMQTLVALDISERPYVAVGASGAIMTSDDGRAWTSRNRPPHRDLWDVAFDGEQTFAVGWNGLLVRSADRTSWTTIPTGASSSLMAISRAGNRMVAVGSDGTVVVGEDNGTHWATTHLDGVPSLNDVLLDGTTIRAVGGNGIMVTSTDGESWTVDDTGLGGTLEAIISDGSQLVVLQRPDSSSAQIATSPDGVDWTTTPLGTSGPMYDLAFTGSAYVVVGAMGQIHRSEDGQSFSPVDSTTFEDLHAVTWTGSRLVAVGAASTVLTSPDGVTWTSDPTGPRSTETLYGVTAAGSSVVAVGSSGTVLTGPASGPLTPAASTPASTWVRSLATDGDLYVAADGGVLISNDGRSWTRPPSVLRGISNVLWTGRRLLALETGAVSSSVDGLTWDRQSVHLTTPRMLLSGASNGSRTVLVGHDVALLSDDDQTWTEVAPAEGWMYDVVWNGDRFIAVGSQDRGPLEYGVAIATSEDGTSWTTRRIGPGPLMSGVARLGEMLVAVGTRGTEAEGTAQAVVLTSTDGLSWEEHRLGLQLTLLAVESTGYRLVAAASDGTLLWSDDGVSWRTETVPGVSSGSSLLWNGEHLLLGGSGIVRLGCDAVPSVLEPGTYLSMVPAAANVAGQAGTSWRTDTVLHNPGARPSRCQLYFLESGNDNTGALGEPLTVPASGSIGLDDTLPSLFGRTDTSGALLIGCDRPAVIASRTYNDAPQGSFGQLIPGLPIGSVLDQTSFLTGLTHDSDYRTNLGLVNPGPDPVQLVVDLWAADGSWLGSRSYDLPGLGWTQDGNAVLEIAGTEVSGAYASIRAGSPAGPYLAYASVIDNSSGDPIFALPARPANQPLYIPAAAHSEGVNQTVWRTDLEVANPGSIQARYTIELLRSRQDSSTPLARTYELAPGHAAHYPDILAQLFSLDGMGALRITPNQGSVVVSSRTFNQLADGTRGQYIPGFAADTAITDNEQVWLVALRRSASTTTGYRTNIGVASASPTELEVVIDLYRADGSEIGTRTLTLAPYEHRQISDALGLPGAGEVELGMARVHSATPGAAYFAYASVADNRSGDPIYIPAVPAQ